MDDISHGHPTLSRCKFVYVTAVRSCDVIKGSPKCFLPIASHRKELQHRARSHCVYLIKTHRMIYLGTFWPWGHVKVTWPEFNWWPWPYEIMICIFRCVSKRGSRWSRPHLCTASTWGRGGTLGWHLCGSNKCRGIWQYFTFMMEVSFLALERHLMARKP